jgi:hypothetical protein
VKTVIRPDETVDKLLSDLGLGGWYSGVGEPLTEGELADAEAYAAGLGLGPLAIREVRDWRAAQAVASHPGWDPRWWAAEEGERRALYAHAAAEVAETDLLAALTRLTEAAAEEFYGPAAVAMARAGIADQGLARAAAGSAAQSLYQLALARQAGRDDSHLFAAKYRLFQGGRWPLCVVDGALYVF